LLARSGMPRRATCVRPEAECLQGRPSSELVGPGPAAHHEMRTRIRISVFTCFWAVANIGHSSPSHGEILPPSGLSVSVVKLKFWTAVNSDGLLTILVENAVDVVDLDVTIMENVAPYHNLSLALDGSRIHRVSCVSVPCSSSLLSVGFGNHSLQAINASGSRPCILKSRISGDQQMCINFAVPLAFELKAALPTSANIESKEKFEGNKVSLMQYITLMICLDLSSIDLRCRMNCHHKAQHSTASRRQRRRATTNPGRSTRAEMPRMRRRTRSTMSIRPLGTAPMPTPTRRTRKRPTSPPARRRASTTRATWASSSRRRTSASPTPPRPAAPPHPDAPTPRRAPAAAAAAAVRVHPMRDGLGR
jgi:hypothetical protein